MSAAATLPDPPSLQIIGAMTECAYALGRAASEMALAAKADTDRFLALSAEFRHCFFAVRMGIRLSQFGVAAPRAAGVQAEAEPLEVERPEVEPPERPDPDDARTRIESEREWEGDREPLSLPKFLSSLGLVAAGAERRKAELPATLRDNTLPKLHALLAQANAPLTLLSRPAVAATRPGSRPPASRSHLLTSTISSGVPPPRRPSG